MVKSLIQNSISYSEVKSIEEQDSDFNATMYIVEIHDQNCLIALGKLNKMYESKNIFYVPIYLVNNEEVIAKIGVFEFEKDQEVIIYDAERDFNLEKFDMPLLFGFVTKEYIINQVKSLNIPELDDESYVEEEKESEKSVEVEGKKEESLKFPFEDDNEDLVEIENESKSEEEKSNYSEEVATNRMQKYMKNLNYEIENVEANGDCFFAVLREAFVGIPLEVTVSELRNIVADHFDKNTFDVRKERYIMFKENLEAAKLEKIEAEKKYTKKKKELMELFSTKKKESEKATQQYKQRLVKEALNAKTEWKKVKKILTALKKKKEEELKIATENFNDYKIMKNVDTIEQFKEKIKTSEYWADEWVIKKLESLLNIKMIIFSKEKFEEGEIENVLNCGGEFSEHIKKKGIFKPMYYIITVHTGDHFKLVKYKDRRIFRYNEIPFDVKKNIREKCMETSVNSEWNLISKFKATSGKSRKSESVEDSKSEDEEEDGSKSKPKKKSKKKLYNDGAVFQFYSKSADAPKPGKGSGESINPDRVKDFTELALKENKGWRKVLSNFYPSTIQIDGKQWYSVEHYFQAAKFKEINPEYYFTFSLDDASSKINKDPKKAKSAGRKVRLSTEEIKKWNARSSGVMKKAQLEKYRINDYAKKILLLTKDAKLLHYLGRGQGNVDFTETMEIRDQLRED